MKFQNRIIRIIFSHYKIKTTAFILSLWLFNIGCNKFQIENFPSENNPEKSLYLTSHLNYQRNSVSTEEISPPLSILWQDDYSGLAINGFTLVDSIIFLGTGNGYLFALNNSNGDVLGKKKFGRALGVPPTIYNEYLYQTYESGSYGLIAYSVKEGEIIWEIEDNLSKSSPIVTDNKVFFQTKNGNILCLNYLTGELIWSQNLKTKSENSLAYDNNVIFTANSNGIVTALEYTSGIQMWQQDLSDIIFADPVLDENFVYISTYSGTLYILNKTNGQIISQINNQIPMYHAITTDNNSIFIPLSNGNIKAIDKNNYTELWSFQGEGPATSSVLVTKNYIYFATLGKYLYILEKKSGKLLQEIEFEGRLRSIPLIKNGKLVIACEDKYVNIYTSSK